jgi:enoyl-CoA hydratase/carnithine racemase
MLPPASAVPRATPLTSRCASRWPRRSSGDAGSPRRVGPARAQEVVLSGRRVPADEALAIGLADRPAPPGRRVAEALAWARSLPAGPAPALALARAARNRSLTGAIQALLALAGRSGAICRATGAHREALSAFLDQGRSARRERPGTAAPAVPPAPPLP